MAVGLIASPLSWQNGTAALPGWFQQVQDNINAMVGGTAAVALGTAAGTTAPTPPFIRGALYLESLPFAMVSSDGTNMIAGVNIAAFVRTGTGNFQIDLGTAASATNRIVCAASSAGGFVNVAASTTSRILVGVLQVSTTPTVAFANNPFTLVAYHV
jgi:hypothetical protein